MFTSYDTFVILAGTLQWDEAALDFAPDKAAWPALGDSENAHVLGLIAGFCIAEWAVAGHLGSFQAAADDEAVAACFRAQARDEDRHARFFDRVAAEVAAVPGADMAARLDVLRTLVSPELVALFEERLPATALRLAEDRRGLSAAVGLYHMVLEGVVLLAGQNALLDTLNRLSVGLPGVRRGVELVLRDERWHIGFGTRLVQGAGLGHDEVETILALGQASASAWGDLVSPDAADRAARMHRNRLRGVNRKFFLSRRAVFGTLQLVGGRTRRPVSGCPVPRRVRGLPHFDQVAVRVADVAALLVLVLFRRGQELSPPGAPFGVHGLDVFDPDIEEAADPVGITRRLQDDRRLVVGRSSAGIDDDPGVGQRDIGQPSGAGEGLPAAEYFGVEAPRALDIAGDDEVGQRDSLWRRWELGHLAPPLVVSLIPAYDGVRSRCYAPRPG